MEEKKETANLVKSGLERCFGENISCEISDDFNIQISYRPEGSSQYGQLPENLICDKFRDIFRFYDVCQTSETTTLILKEEPLDRLGQ